MHPYSTDSEERKHVPLIMAIVAIGCAIGVSWILAQFGLELPWWAPPVDTMGFYGLLYQLFDKVLWRWKLVRLVGGSRVPDLNGEWYGLVTPGNAMHPSARYDLTLSIRQTWTKIQVELQANLSQSLSSVAFISCEDRKIKYLYENVAGPAASPTMHSHEGAATLQIDEERDRLKGSYFTGRDRQSFGAIEVSRRAH